MLHATPASAVDEREPSERLSRWIGSAFGLAFAVLWGLSVVRPPAPATIGLDQSWRIGLTLAADHHLQFGRDVVFTFGPLGYVLAGSPDPALAPSVAILTALLLAVSVLGIATLFAGRSGLMTKIVCVAALLAFGSVVGFDYAIFGGTLALLMRAGRHPRTAPFVGIAVGLVALFGALSKYTLALDILGASTAIWLVDAFGGPARRRRAALLATALSFAIVAIGVAATFRFSPTALAPFVRGAVEVTRGYSVAMAISGPRVLVLEAFVVAVAVMTVGIAAWRDGKRTLLPLAAVTLFLAWKHGFVRQDGHVMAYFATAAVLAAMTAMVVRRSRTTMLAVGSAIVSTVMLLAVNDQIGGEFPKLFPVAQVQDGVTFLTRPIDTTRRLAAASEGGWAPDRLSPAALARIKGSTVDTVPDEIALIAANGLNWRPLPVFQAYAAFTPYLDRINREALVDHGAEYEIYRYEAIDNRLPFSEMPATTTEMICRYRVAMSSVTTAGNGSYALLQRTPGAGCATTDAGRSDAGIGQPIAVPRAGSPAEFIVASFHLRPTLLTTVRTALWRAPSLELDVRLDDGTTHRWRLVTDTAAGGVVISTAPRDMPEATRFLAGATVPAVREITMIGQPHSYVLDGVSFTRERRTSR